MRCSKCGTDYDPADQFCRNCGRPIVHFSEQPDEAQGNSAAAVESDRDRKRIKRLKFISVSIVLVALLAVIFAQVAPGLLDSVGLTPKDLGVTWTDEDYASILAKTDIKADEPPEGTDKSKYNDVYTGQKDIDWTLTQSEITAWLNNESHPGYWPFSNMQLKILPGNVMEASMSMNPAAILTWPEVTDFLPGDIKSFLSHLPMDIPMYVKGQVTITGPKQVDIHLQQAVAEGFALPDLENNDMANQILENIINGVLGKIDQVNVSSFTTVDGSLTMKGAWYEEQERVPAK
jgi:hypothetical protein